MTKEEALSILKAAEKQLEEIESLKAEIENLKSKLNEVQENEIPITPHIERGEYYWFIGSDLKIDRLGSYISYEAEDYNSFHSEEYATIFATKCREIAMLLHCKWYYDKELITDFSDESIEKWCLWYDHHSNKWTIDCQ